MNIEELEEALDELLPSGFSIEHLEDGQIVIYTGLMQDDDGELIQMDEDDEEYDEDTEPLGDEDDEDDE